MFTDDVCKCMKSSRKKTNFKLRTEIYSYLYKKYGKEKNKSIDFENRIKNRG